jgi:hypothetical protein
MVAWISELEVRLGRVGERMDKYMGCEEGQMNPVFVNKG